MSLCVLVSVSSTWCMCAQPQGWSSPSMAVASCTMDSSCDCVVVCVLLDGHTWQVVMVWCITSLMDFVVAAILSWWDRWLASLVIIAICSVVTAVSAVKILTINFCEFDC